MKYDETVHELETIYKTTHDGIAIMDLETRFLDCNPAYLKMTGFTKDELLEKSCVELSASEDIERSKKVVAEVIDKGFVDFYDKTCVIKNDKRIYVHMSLSLLPDKQRILIATRDMTWLLQEQKRFKSVVNVAPIPIALMNDNQEVLYFNDAFIKTFGYRTEEVPTAQTWWPKAYSDAEYQQLMQRTWEERVEHYVQEGFKKFDPIEAVVTCKDGCKRRGYWILSRFKNYFIIVFNDTTELFEKEQKAKSIKQAYTALSAVNEIIAKAQDEKCMYQDICNELHEHSDYTFVWIGLKSEDEERNVHVAAHAGLDDGFVNALKVTYAEGPWGNGPAGRTIREQHPVLVQDIMNDPAFEPWRDAAKKNGFLSLVGLPISYKESMYGSLTCYHNEKDAFEKEEIALLQRLAQNIGFGISSLRAQKESQKAQESLKVTASVFEHSSDGIIVTDKNSVIIKVNPSFCAITGYSEKELIGKRPNILKSNRHDKLFYENIWDDLLTDGKWQGEIWNRKKSGELYVQYQTIDAVYNEQNKISRYVSVVNDITELKEQEKRIRFLAYHDALTGLPNRTLFHDRIEQAIARSRRDRLSFALLFIDLDRFKQINDTMGHNFGDMLLQVIAQRLLEVTRERDTVARMGGDEFVVLAEELEEKNGAAILSQRLIEKVTEPLMLIGNDLTITTSVGVALYPRDGDNADELMKHADTAMYAAKTAGRNTFRFFDVQMNDAAEEKLKLEMELRRAVENNQFELYYQPKVTIDDGTMYGAEALIRWNHPTDGVISPTKFIPLAEESDLIDKIGDWVLEAAFRDLSEWKKEGLELIQVSINIASSQLKQEDFSQKIEAFSKQYDVGLDYIQFEITEGSFIDNPIEASQKLTTLRALGASIAIDDFGTGYSSLSYLKQLPIDVVKIDKSFIEDVDHDTNDAGLVSGIVAIANALHKSVVAEGIETQMQLDKLKQLKCVKGQGFFFSKPLPKNRFNKWVSQKR